MTNLFSRIYSETPIWLFAAVIIGGVCACDRPDTSLSSPPMPPQGVDAGPTAVAKLMISPKERRLDRLLTGPYRVEYTHVDTGMVTDELVLDFANSWPIEYALPPNLVGRFQVIIYQDNTIDQTFNDCPFPPQLRDTELLGEVDNIQAHAQVDLPLGSNLDMQLQARICGLGTANTGFKASLKNETNESLSKLMLFAEGQIPSYNSDKDTDILIPIEPSAIGANGEVDFAIGELLPGTYRLTLFTDGDGDGRPSPCNLGLGGGDRHVSVIENVEIISGEITEITEPFLFRSRNCADELTGVRGYLSLAPTIAMNAQDTDQLGLLSGPLQIRFNPVEMSRETIIWTISDSISSDFLPRTFSVTGLETGLWNVMLFLDRDENQSYTPCDGLPSGFDTIWSSVEDVNITAGDILDLGRISMESKPCGQDALSGIRGEILFPIQNDSHGSGRPVRMELQSLEDDEDQISILLVENHWLTEGRLQSFIKEVEPGRYRGRIYLDTNRDGIFTPCSIDPNGDRSYTQEFMAELAVGQVSEIGQPEMAEDPCNPPDHSIGVIIEKGDAVDIDPDRMRISITEQGGWASDQALGLRSVGDVWAADSVEVASGRYALTVYLDQDNDQQYSSCTEGGNDRYVGQVEMEVGMTNPSPQIQLTLETLCND